MSNWWWEGLSQLYQSSGAVDTTTHPPEPKKVKPKCTICKKYIGYEAGMHLFITEEDRMHISCFRKRVDKLIESGKLKDIKDVWY